MQIQNRIKYQVVCCIEREMHIVGIYPSMEEAKKAMLLDMAEALNCSPEDIKAANAGEEDATPDCEELGIGETSAWANNVGLSHANYDWNIFALTCDGECREYVPGDEDVINATYRSYWSSGAHFDAPCKVNVRTHKVFDIGSAGHAADDDSCFEEDVIIRDNNADDEYEVVSLDSILDENGTEEAMEWFINIKQNGLFWRSNRFETLDDAIAFCKK